MAAQVEARAAALGLCIEQTAKEHLLNEMPTKRFVGPTEVASAMLLLCSGTARSITRSIALPVDGKCVENCCPGLVAIAGRNPATLGTLMVMETLKAVAHPWFCDAMGHLNVRFYTAFFDDASSFFVGGLGGGADQLGASHLGWADVRHVVEFREEVRSGGLLRVCSRVIKVGRTSLTFQHELTGPSGNLHATMEVVSVMFDLLKRQAVPLPANIRTAAEHLLTQQVE
ncbi:acyl-CoA thioesterase FadM [Rhizobium mesoamericanum]|nr:acyl-CoA thioesterase FadM [Rhizobium mesoamericanum]